MSYHYDADMNWEYTYDDRDEDEPEFVIDEELAFSIEVDERDPADDGVYC